MFRLYRIVALLLLAGGGLRLWQDHSAGIDAVSVFSKSNGHELMETHSSTAPVKSEIYGGVSAGGGSGSSNILSLEDMERSDLKRYALPLAQSTLHTHENFVSGRNPRFVDEDGVERRFNPEFVLVGFSGAEATTALHVEAGSEIQAVKKLKQRGDVRFAELDTLMERQFAANDGQLGRQWHHSRIHSADAWNITLGSSAVQVAIVDLPFQMDHPDLAANTLPGWDEVTGLAITKSEGDFHSTIGAGLVAAVINNFRGVAGMANVIVLPINIDGFISDMDAAIRWAADHGVRVVNISYDGCYSSVLNAAGEYLQDKAKGLLVMAGVNQRSFLSYPNQPAILAISMTDQTDQQVSSHGQHIDFAAPGWEIYSTTTNYTYEVDSGTSYSAPIVSGAIAFLLSINPDLKPSEVIDILTRTAVDLGTPGWDEYYGWGELDFGKAALEAFATIPASKISIEPSQDRFQLSTEYVPGATYSLYRSGSLLPGDWQEVPDFASHTNGSREVFLDPTPSPTRQFYQLRVRLD